MFVNLIYAGRLSRQGSRHQILRDSVSQQRQQSDMFVAPACLRALKVG